MAFIRLLNLILPGFFEARCDRIIHEAEAFEASLEN